MNNVHTARLRYSQMKTDYDTSFFFKLNTNFEIIKTVTMLEKILKIKK